MEARQITTAAVVNGTVYAPGESIPNGAVVMQGNQITAVGPRGSLDVPAGAELIDATGLFVVPGLIDLHLHGLLGHDCMGAGLEEVIRALPAFGVTSFVAATHTLARRETHACLAAMTQALESRPQGAHCLGIYLEGPFLSPARPGMADVGAFEPPTWESFVAYQEAAAGLIRVAALAPEIEGAMEIIPLLVESGVVPALAHSDAGYEQVEEAVVLGMSLAAHTFNAMRPFHHRDPGALGAVLNRDEIVAEVVGDGVHVHPAAISILLRAKGLDRVALVSDAAPFAAMPEGEYTWDGRPVTVRDGACRLADGTLAGAHALLDTGVRTLVQGMGMPLEQALLSAAGVPAALLGIRKGRLAPGFDADIALLDSGLRPAKTIVGGEVLFSAE